MKPTLLLPALAVSLLATGAHSATLLVSDEFSYPDGPLVGNTPSPGPGGTWASHSGTADDLLVTGGAAIVQHGTPSEDANIAFAEQTTGILTATFDIVVTSDAVIGGGDYEYFAHFFTNTTFNFRSRVDVQAPTVAGDYTLGISSETSTAEATLTQDFTFGETVGVLISFDFSTGTGSLTVGSETISGSASGAGQSLNAFALRQSDSSNNETISVDNLVVSQIPEPSVTLLGGLGLLGLLRRRR